MGIYRPVGKRVAVMDPETGHVLFTGHRASGGSPWMFWSRIIPDQEIIDLPPKYKVVESVEPETAPQDTLDDDADIVRYVTDRDGKRVSAVVSLEVLEFARRHGAFR